PIPTTGPRSSSWAIRTEPVRPGHPPGEGPARRRPRQRTDLYGGAWRRPRKARIASSEDATSVANGATNDDAGGAHGRDRPGPGSDKPSNGPLALGPDPGGDPRRGGTAACGREPHGPR